MPNVIEKFIEKEYRSRQVPDFKVGDVVRVHQIVPDIKKGEVKSLSKAAKAIKKTSKDGDSGPALRTQVFEGTVIAKKHGREPGATFTVRKIASGNIGVEKIFPLYSPLLEKIEVVSRPSKRVRRSKIYFLRDRVGKKARKFGVGTAVEQAVTSVDPLVSQEASDGEDQGTSDEEPKTLEDQNENPDASKEGSEPQPTTTLEEKDRGSDSEDVVESAGKEPEEDDSKESKDSDKK